MNLKVGEKYWTIESREGSSAGLSEPWLAEWRKRIGFSDAHYFWSDEHLSGDFWPSCDGRRFTVKVYATELEAKKAYVSAMLQEAHDLMARAKQITGVMKEYVKSNEDLKRTFRAQDGGDLY